MKRWVLPSLAVLLLLVVAIVDGTQAPGRSVVAEPVDRVLVVSMPGVRWADVQAHDLPHLEQLVSEAAIGQLSTRVGRRGASLTDAYLSLGAGTRSLAPAIDPAVALDPEEFYGGIRATDILHRRVGRVPDGIAYLSAGAARQRNLDGPFGGEPGRLGELLEEAGVARAVVANADAAEGFPTDEPPPEGAYGRAAATMLMGREGIVPGGSVGRDLLVDDPSAPFGRRLDPEVVLSAVDAAWAGSGRSVLLVEASDLARATAYGPRATADQRRQLRADALASTDALLGELLERADDRTAVLVLSPVAPAGAPELAIVALRAPAVDGGVLRSATTRRDGYVQLSDVAPTILRLLGEDEPDDVEGRSFEVATRPAEGRLAELVDEADAAGFRDSLMPVVVPVVIAGLVAMAALRLWRSQLPPALGALVAPLAHLALGVVPSTYLLAQVPAVDSTTAYLLGLGLLSAALGAVSRAIDRVRPGLGTILALGGIVALFSLDVLAGAPLQVNAVFGYSVAVAGRFAGIGNLAFALYAAATVLLGTLAVDRWGARAIPWVTALFVGVVLVEGMPMLGADVGGVVSVVPAFVLVLLVLHGVRLRPVHVAAAGGAAAAAVLAFGLVDAARPPGERTHLSRLAEHLGAGRLGSFSGTISRRLQASFGDPETAAWLLVLGLVAVVGAYVVLVGRGRIVPGAPRNRTRPRWMEGPTATAAFVGLCVLASVGLIANDSSIAVPTTMLIVVAPVAVLRSQGASG